MKVLNLFPVFQSSEIVKQKLFQEEYVVKSLTDNGCVTLFGMVRYEGTEE